MVQTKQLNDYRIEYNSETKEYKVFHREKDYTVHTLSGPNTGLIRLLIQELFAKN